MSTIDFSKPHWRLVSRITAAFFPAFILTNTLGVMIVLLLPFDRLATIAWITVLAFAFYAVLILWIFHAQSVSKVWGLLMSFIVVTSFVNWGLIVLGRAQ